MSCFETNSFCDRPLVWYSAISATHSSCPGRFMARSTTPPSGLPTRRPSADGYARREPTVEHSTQPVPLRRCAWAALLGLSRGEADMLGSAGWSKGHSTRYIGPMAPKEDELLADLLKLPVEKRAKFAHELLLSLDEESSEDSG